MSKVAPAGDEMMGRMYETTSIRETVVGLGSWLWMMFNFVLFFLCNQTRELLFGPKESPVVQGRTPLLKTMNALAVTEVEATKFFKLFEKVDGDHSGNISIEEFFTFYKIQPTEFAQRAFAIMDFEGGHEESAKRRAAKGKMTTAQSSLHSMGKDGRDKRKKRKEKERTFEEKVADGATKQRSKGDGNLSYSEFFLSLWNFCTLTHETLVKFAFDLYDLDGSGSLTIDEIFEMVKMMHPSRDEKYAKRQTNLLMEIMDRGPGMEAGDGDVTFKEFFGAHRKLGTVIFPAFMLQKAIRGRGMSKRFWDKATKKRKQILGEGGGTAEDIISMYEKFCLEKEAYQVDEADNEDDNKSVESRTEEDMLAEFEKLKDMKKHEREEWAKNAKMEFYDEGQGGGKANGLLLALASKRLQGKIYHTPREGSWWNENPDVAAPRPPGVRPNSAVFKGGKTFVHEDEPNVILDRRTADLMFNVEKARERSMKSIKKAKRSIKDAKSSIAVMDGKESGLKATRGLHIIPYPVKRQIIRMKRKAKKSQFGQRVGRGKEMVKGRIAEKLPDKVKNVNFPPLLSPKKRTGQIEVRTPDDTTDEEEEEDKEDTIDEIIQLETPLAKALGRGRKRPTSANKHVQPRPRSAQRPIFAAAGRGRKRVEAARQARTRPKSAGPSIRRRIHFEA